MQRGRCNSRHVTCLCGGGVGSINHSTDGNRKKKEEEVWEKKKEEALIGTYSPPSEYKKWPSLLLWKIDSFLSKKVEVPFLLLLKIFFVEKQEQQHLVTATYGAITLNRPLKLIREITARGPKGNKKLCCSLLLQKLFPPSPNFLNFTMKHYIESMKNY